MIFGYQEIVLIKIFYLYYSASTHLEKAGLLHIPSGGLEGG
jgi:hypothetical protein